MQTVTWSRVSLLGTATKTGLGTGGLEESVSQCRTLGGAEALAGVLEHELDDQRRADRLEDEPCRDDAQG